MSDDDDKPHRYTDKQRRTVHEHVDRWLNESETLAQLRFQSGVAGEVGDELRLRASVDDEGLWVIADRSVLHDIGPDDDEVEA